MHKHATAFDLVLWATMVGAFDLAEVLWKHKSCESPLRAALIGQARHRTAVATQSHPPPVGSACPSPSRASPGLPHPNPGPSQEMCRRIGVKKKLRVQKLQQYSELLSEYSLGILEHLNDQEEARRQ